MTTKMTSEELLAFLKENVKPADKSYYFKTYKEVFTGKEVVDLMVKEDWCTDRKEAVELVKPLVVSLSIHHVTYDHTFQDSGYFYRFGDTAAKLNCSETRARQYDVVVIGAGSGGLTAADFAVKLGARVCLVEKEKIGGDCTWYGCVPSKALLKCAKIAWHARTASHYGVNIDSKDVKVDMKAVKAYVEAKQQLIYEEEGPEVQRAKGMRVEFGTASLVDANTVKIVHPDGKGTTTVTSNNVLLCTGASVFHPKIPGLDTVKYWTYETIFQNEELPESLIVVGTGPIGCELAQAYHRLGSNVTLVGRAILPQEEPEVTTVMSAVFEKEGLNFVKGRAKSVKKADDGGVIVTVGDKEYKAAALLVSVGRRPNIDDINLDVVGVATNKSGIVVNNKLQTNIPNVYAAGDCAGSYQFTHYAGWQAFRAIRNMLAPGSQAAQNELCPWSTFTDPEVGHVGLTKEDCEKQHAGKYRTITWDNKHNDRAICDSDDLGFITLHVHINGKILGCTVVSARAGEMITEITLAMTKDMTITDVANAIHAYPSYSFSMMQLAAQHATDDWLKSFSGKLVRNLVAKD